MKVTTSKSRRDDVEAMAADIYVKLPKNSLTEQNWKGIISQMEMAFEHAELFYFLADSRYVEQKEEAK
jgi:hypothetical protein